MISVPCLQSYQWLNDKILSEDGRKQQAKLKELGHIAEKLGCTLPQLAVGEDCWKHKLTYCNDTVHHPACCLKPVTSSMLPMLYLSVFGSKDDALDPPIA